MIAVDTSTLIAFFSGEDGSDVQAVEDALRANQVALPPVVLSELLSDRTGSKSLRSLLSQIPLLAILDGYWERVGLIRASVFARHRRARLADALIAQSCIDHNALLVTRDGDFRSFAQVSGLRLRG